MVYIKIWTEFETAATELYAKSPNRVRYCVKFKPKTGQLVLKVTDDTTCIKYKTFSSIILNRFETLNLRLLSQIANLPKPVPQPIVPAAAAGSGSGSGSLLHPPTANIGRAGTPLTGDEDEGASGLSGAEGRAGTPGPGSGSGAGTGGKAGGAGGASGGAGGGGGRKKKKGKR